MGTQGLVQRVGSRSCGCTCEINEVKVGSQPLEVPGVVIEEDQPLETPTNDKTELRSQGQPLGRRGVPKKSTQHSLAEASGEPASSAEGANGAEDESLDGSASDDDIEPAQGQEAVTQVAGFAIGNTYSGPHSVIQVQFTS
jgi:hypothetical protein